MALPNGQVISAIAEGTLTLSTSPLVRIPDYVFKDTDLHQSLLGLAPLTNDADCQITLDKNEIVIRKDDQVVARTSKRPSDKLWKLDLQQRSTVAQANLGMRLESDAEYVAFAHECFGSPVASTFHAAAQRGFLANYRRLTAAMIATHRPNTLATAKGHLDQTRQGLRSTKVPPAVVLAPETNTDMNGVIPAVPLSTQAIVPRPRSFPQLQLYPQVKRL